MFSFFSSAQVVLLGRSRGAKIKNKMSTEQSGTNAEWQLVVPGFRVCWEVVEETFSFVIILLCKSFLLLLMLWVLVLPRVQFLTCWTKKRKIKSTFFPPILPIWQKWLKLAFNLLCQMIFKLSIRSFKIKICLKLQSCDFRVFRQELATTSGPGPATAYECASEPTQFWLFLNWQREKMFPSFISFCQKKHHHIKLVLPAWDMKTLLEQ